MENIITALNEAQANLDAALQKLPESSGAQLVKMSLSSINYAIERCEAMADMEIDEDDEWVRLKNKNPPKKRKPKS